MNSKYRMLVALSFGLCLAAASWQSQCASGDDPQLQKRAAWKPAELSDVRLAIEQWLNQLQPDQLTRSRVDLMLDQAEEPFAQDPIGLVASAIALIQPELLPLLDGTRPQRAGAHIPPVELIEDEQLPGWVQSNLHLLVGRWMAQNELYDEALLHLQPLSVNDVVDPASLLFYSGLSHHRLLNRDECVQSLEQLLTRREAIPRRFESVAQLMLADIGDLQFDTLNEISRLMDDIRRRQALYRAGTRVRQQEQQVLDKLDKMIEEAEKQLQQQQQASAGQAPSAPMQDSQNAGGTGAGDVDNRRIDDGGGWGDLPPQQRAAALAEMAKDLPPHFREVIEEYFRQLARGKDR